MKQPKREKLVLIIRVLWLIAKALLSKAKIEVENPDNDDPDIFRVRPV